ncbi:hypothetical protein BKA56DRAFT_212232 [Ilyonectria sp. MPI-CAGE-AT-0026]|nr:hypothetical protein BKA56DRAFT_212232 [Ilyonectria sp. MPI-CAGE-AT-0026]
MELYKRCCLNYPKRARYSGSRALWRQASAVHLLTICQASNFCLAAPHARSIHRTSRCGEEEGAGASVAGSKATIRIHGCIASRAVLSGVCLWQLERTNPLLTPNLARRTGPWTQLLLLGWNWEALAHPQCNWHCRMDSRAGKLGMTCMSAEVRLVRSLRVATVIEPQRARSMADRVQQTWGIRPACHREAMHIETSPQNLSDLRWFVVCQEERR